jgi:hypothetical protein
MRSAVTAPMIESLTSIGPPFLGRTSLIIVRLSDRRREAEEN